jgi:uracil DNA glycosylase
MTTDVFKGKVHESWFPLFQSPLGELYIKTLSTIVANHPQKDNQGFNISKDLGFKLLPRLQDILHPFRCVNLNDVKVVILFDQPMENIGCTGIPLQVIEGVPRLRTNLLNVFEDTYQIYKDNPFTTFNLSNWMNQGILLINACMTREMVNSNSHINYWSDFTQLLIDKLYIENNNILFVSIGTAVHTIEFPDKAKVIYTPLGACNTDIERAIFHKYKLFDKINQELKTIDESISISW